MPPCLVHMVRRQRRNSKPSTRKQLKGGRSLVFCWVPDGTTKYRRLTKDRGEAPERGKVGYLPTATDQHEIDQGYMTLTVLMARIVVSLLVTGKMSFLMLVMKKMDY